MTGLFQCFFVRGKGAFARLSALLLTVCCAGIAMADTSGDWFINESFDQLVLPRDWQYREQVKPHIGWLQLTEPKANQSGYTWFKHPFSSADGLVITFDFTASEGGGRCGFQPADGFSVFLIDNIPDNQFVLGDKGGGLGYKNLRKAYLGVGFDSFGNFSTPEKPQTSDSIVIRAGHNKRYAYLAGERIRFPIANKNWGRKPRTARITILPYGSSYQVSVSLDSHDGRGFQSFIRNIKTDTPPPYLKLGFAASTGCNWARHEIRNGQGQPACCPDSGCGRRDRI